MFTQECFIRKNTKELRKKLRDLGFLDNTCFTSFDNFLYTLGGDYYTCKDYNKFSNMRSEEFVSRCIDCGTNEELFLAIAALRDDSDYMQWFVDDETKYDEYNGMELTHKGDWNLCTESRYEDYDGHKELKHKATIEELIEHFKDD